MIIPNDKIIYYFMLILSNLDSTSLSRLNDYPVSYKANYQILMNDDLPSTKFDKENWYIAVTDLTRKEAFLSIGFPTYYVISESNHQHFKKIFMYLLYEINRQAYSNNNPITDTVYFHINELVEYHLYKDIRTARTALKNALDFFNHIFIRLNEGNINFIEKYEIKNSVCSFRFYDVYALFSHQNYIDIPKEYFSLSNRSSTLLWYLLYMTRVNCYKDNPKKKENVNISLEAVQRLLALPLISKNKSVKKTVIQPLQEAIKDVLSVKQDILDIEYKEDTRSPYFFFKNSRLTVKYKENYIPVDNIISNEEIEY